MKFDIDKAQLLELGKFKKEKVMKITFEEEPKKKAGRPKKAEAEAQVEQKEETTESVEE